MRKVLSVIIGSLFLLSLVLPSVAIADDQVRVAAAFEKAPEVQFQVSMPDGKPAASDVGVLIYAHIDGKVKKVFSGPTSKDGRVVFSYDEPKLSLAAKGDQVGSVVFEAFFLSKDFETVNTVFSVPYVANVKDLPIEVLVDLAGDRTQVIPVTFEKELPAFVQQHDSVASVSSTLCDLDPVTYKYVCLDDYVTNSTTVVAGEYHISDGVNVEATLKEGSSYTFQVGAKSTSGAPWSIEGSLKIVTGRSAESSFDEFGSSWGGLSAYGVKMRPYFGYAYSHWTVKPCPTCIPESHSYTVKPTGMLPGGTREKFYSPPTGASAANVEAGRYGYPWHVEAGQWTSQNIESERSIDGAFSIPTPVGTFTAGITTGIRTTNTIKWIGTHKYRKYWFFDNYTNKAIWYAASPDTRP